MFIGDSGYPLRTWLLTPLENEPPANTPEYNYNNAHKTTRNTIERCNGVLKMRFRCLLKERVLHYKPVVACRIINSCVVLHNMCMEYNIPLVENNNQNEDIDLEMFNNIEEGADRDNLLRRVNPELTAGRRTRDRLMRTVFQNN